MYEETLVPHTLVCDGGHKVVHVSVSSLSNEEIVEIVRGYNEVLAEEIDSRFRFYFDNISYEQWKEKNNV